MIHKKPAQSSPPSYYFHGSNSSHSKDNGSGGRTYHIPNYATSYANEKSNLISVSFDEDKKTSKAILAVIMVFLLFAAVPLAIIMSKPLQKIETRRQPSSNVEPQVPSSGTQDWTPNPKHGTSDLERDLEREQDKKSREYLKNDKESHPRLEDELIAEVEKPHVDLKARTLFWDEPTPDMHCFAFGKRRYTAELHNVPFYVNWSRACEKTEVVIQGVPIKRPSACKTEWPFGRIIGRWIVDTKDENCLANWGKFFDKGCVKKDSKLRRFQSRLWNIKAGEDWMTLCNTAPAVIRGISIPKPTSCDDQGIWGIYGVWDLEDDRC